MSAPDNPMEYIIRIAIARKEVPIRGKIWSYAPDEHWRVRVNGTNAAVDGCPPYHTAVEWCGWPAGLLHPITGGFIAAGELANIDTLNEALREAAEREEAGSAG